MKHHEEILQQLVVAMLRRKNILFLANPYANLYLPKHVAVRMKRLGYITGTPDIILLEPRKHGNIQYHGLAIELKVYKNTLTALQELFLAKMGSMLYKIAVVPKGHTIESAYNWVENEIERYI